MKPILLCILDGVGISTSLHGNAVEAAYMPCFKDLLANYSNCLLEASGRLVGLPDGQMGNSEVGHMNIGAGRVFYQPLQLINEAISDKTFYQNKEILNTMHHVKVNGSKLHLLGLLSNGGVHSHINHLFALIDMCRQEGIKDVYYHVFLDGRDTLPNMADIFLEQLLNKIRDTNIGHIATISGRYYAMDRDDRWSRIGLCYEAIVNGNGITASNYKEALAINSNLTDEFIVPTIIDKNGMITSGDGLIFFNYRPDRLRELGMAITNETFSSFPVKRLVNLKVTTMMPVSESVISVPAFNNATLVNTFGEYISKNGLTQLRIAETEKYAHVTYFFDGGVLKELIGCNCKLIPSLKVATYDLAPQMCALEITSQLLKEIDKQIYDVIILNFANGDMVGHTGNFKATVKALETIDTCLLRIIGSMNKYNGLTIVTADHGNSEYMLDDDDNVITSHSMNKVPFIINRKGYHLRDGKLADIAPTILELLELKIPSEMTGQSLIIKGNNKDIL